MPTFSTIWKCRSIVLLHCRHNVKFVLLLARFERQNQRFEAKKFRNYYYIDVSWSNKPFFNEIRNNPLLSKGFNVNDIALFFTTIIATKATYRFAWLVSESSKIFKLRKKLPPFFLNYGHLATNRQDLLSKISFYI